MARKIVILAGPIRAEAELNDSACAAALASALPLTASANTWGDEIYFSTPVRFAQASDARQEMAVGELAYWPPGRALCVFFGPTPASGGDGVPTAASPVNPVGRLLSDPAALRAVDDGQQIVVELAEDKT